MKTELPAELIIKIKEVVTNLNEDYEKVENVIKELVEFEENRDCIYPDELCVCIYPDELCENDLKAINELSDVLAKFVEKFQYLGD